MSETPENAQDDIKPPITPEITEAVKPTDPLASLQSAMTSLHAEAVAQGTTKEGLSLDNANKATLILDGSLTLSDLKTSGFGAIAAELDPLTRHEPGLKAIVKASRTPQLLVAVDISNRRSILEDTDVEGDFRLTEARFFDEYPSSTNIPEPVITISDFEGEGRKMTDLSRKDALDVKDPERVGALSEDLARFTQWAVKNKKGKVYFKQTATKQTQPIS